MSSCASYRPSTKEYDQSLTSLDYGILGGYFALVLSIGIGISLYGYFQRKKSGQVNQVGDFFLASRIGLSIWLFLKVVLEMTFKLL